MIRKGVGVIHVGFRDTLTRTEKKNGIGFLVGLCSPMKNYRLDFNITNVSVSVHYYLEEMMSLSGTQQRAWDFPTVGSIGIVHCTMTEEPVLANEDISVFCNSVSGISAERISGNMNSERRTIENNT